MAMGLGQVHVRHIPVPRIGETPRGECSSAATMVRRMLLEKADEIGTRQESFTAV